MIVIREISFLFSTKIFNDFLPEYCPISKDGYPTIVIGRVSQPLGKTAEESLKKFECHDQHIDIQICIDGCESMGWKPRSSCHSPNGDYSG